MSTLPALTERDIFMSEVEDECVLVTVKNPTHKIRLLQRHIEEIDSVSPEVFVIC